MINDLYHTENYKQFQYTPNCQKDNRDNDVRIIVPVPEPSLIKPRSVELQCHVLILKVVGNPNVQI